MADRLAFRRRASIVDVDFRLGTAVVAADLDAHRLMLNSGAELDYDGVVIATDLAEAVQRHLAGAGIDFVIGTDVVAFTGGGVVTGFELGTGQTLAAEEQSGWHAVVPDT